MTKVTPTEAMEQANKAMDAIFVDDNNSATYLPDLVNELSGNLGTEHNVLPYDPIRVLVESDGAGKLVLTRTNRNGHRAGHYGTILDVDHPEAAQYA